MADNQELERTLWSAADKLRANMDAAEYKHVVLGLIFLKYISDAFNDLHARLTTGEGEFAGADPEDADEYRAYNIFFVPEPARWHYLQDRARQPEIGALIDAAMDAIEQRNPALRGVLPKLYADPELNKQRLGELIDLIGTIGFNQAGHQAQDLLGRVYEYFLGQFADAEGKKGGQFYTPQSIVKLLVAMLEPYAGRVYDGCCGSGGMFVQSERFVQEHQGNIKNLSIFGQESNPTTLRLAKMNLAIRGIDARLELGDTLLNDKHPDLKADYILANPPFNVSDWSGEQLRDDSRWQFGAPPVGNANYAWLQHFLHKLSPGGVAGIVLANGSMNSNTGGEGEIRQRMIEAGVVDCMVALPSQLFYNTMIPACLWFLARDRRNHTFRDRRDEILFIDARSLGTMISRRNRELTDADIARIADTYHAWRGKSGTMIEDDSGKTIHQSRTMIEDDFRKTMMEGRTHHSSSLNQTNHSADYRDIAGFCRAAPLEEVRANNYVLMPGRYVGTEEEVDDGVPFAEKMAALTETLATQFARGAELEAKIRENLRGIGYEF